MPRPRPLRGLAALLTAATATAVLWVAAAPPATTSILAPGTAAGP